MTMTRWTDVQLQEAVASSTNIAQVIRSLGLIHRQRKDGVAAKGAFEAYLSRMPDAPDAASSWTAARIMSR